MKIFILEDAIFKREQITDFLKIKKIGYELSGYARPALRYIMKNKNEISGIILDLGLQNSKDSPESYDLLKGLDIIRELYRKKLHIPVLVNSSTQVKSLNQYPFVYGQRKEIDDYQILEDYISFLRKREEQWILLLFFWRKYKIK